MAEELETYDQVETGDPDPLGLEAKLKAAKAAKSPKTQAPDPLGLEAKLRAIKEPTQQPKQEQTTFKPMTDWLNVPQGYQPMVPENAINPHNTETQKASERIKTHLNDIDNSVRNLLYEHKKDLTGRIKSQELGVNPSEQGPVNFQAQQLAQKDKQDVYVSPVEVESFKSEIPNNPVLLRRSLDQKAKDLSKTNPTDAAILKADIYRVDRQNNPEKENKISKNVEGIKNGELDYDIVNGQLVKPEGFLGSIATGYKEKVQAYDDYGVYQTGDKKAILDLINKRLKHDPDEAMPVAEEGWIAHPIAEFGSMAGGQPLKPILGGIGAGIVTGPQGGAAAAAAIMAPEMYKLTFGATLPANYAAIKKAHPDWPEEQQLQEAIDFTHNQANIDALSGAAMGVLGGKIGLKPTGLNSGLLQKSLGSALTQLGKAGVKKTLEGLGVGTIGASGQLVKNLMAQQEGIPVDESEGLKEQLLGGLKMTLGMTMIAKFPDLFKPKTYNQLLQSFKNVPKETVESELNNLQQSGQITEDQAKNAATAIKEHADIDNSIKPNVPESDRLKVQEKIKKRNELEASLETTDKAYHPDIKEQIKGLNEEIVNLSKGNERGELQNLIDQEHKEGNLRGFVTETLRNASENDLKKYFKEISEQAYDPNSEVVTLATFGENIVNKAKELYPQEQPKESSISVIQPGEIRHPETITISPKEHNITDLRSINAVNKIFENTIGIAGEKGFKTASDKIYRVTQQSQIEDIINSGNIRPPEGKMRGGKSGEVHWARGNKNLKYTEGDNKYILETDKLQNQQKGALSVNDLSAIWKYNKEKNAWENLLPEIKNKIKSSENAIQEKSSLVLPENQYGKSETNKDLFPERSQTQPRINRETAADIIGENQAGRLQASLDWLEAIEGNDSEKSTNAAEELIRESMDAERQRGQVLGNNDRERAQVRTQGNYGGETGAKIETNGTRTPQESEQLRQSSGQLGTSEPIGSQQSASQIEDARAEKSIRGLSEAERKSVVKKIQELSKVRNNTEKAQVTGALRSMLEQAIRENPSKTKEIIDLITNNLPEYGTIRERISKEIPMGETSRNSPQMGARVPESRETAGTQEGAIPAEEGKATGQEGVGEPREIGITHRQMDMISEELGLPKYEGSPEKQSEWSEQAAKKLATDPNALPNLFDKLRNGIPPDAVETKMMLQYMGDLMAKLDKDPYSRPLQDQLLRTKDLFNIAGRIQGKGLAARKGSIPAEETLSDFIIRERETNKAPLTDEQITVSKKEYEEIKAAKDAFEAKLAAEKEKQVKRKAEKIVAEEAKKAKKQSGKDFTTERKQIIDDIAKKWKDSRGQISATLIPYADRLIKIAPDVIKLMKSYVEQGIFELPELVKAIHATIKDHIDGLTEKDVHDIIAGEYNKKKPTRNQLAQQVYDLRKEASLINELEQLENGQIPVSKNKQRQRNQKIEALRAQIKELKDEMGLNEKTDADKLASLKARYKKQISDLENKIAAGDYGPDVKPEPIKLDKEAIELQDKMIKLKLDREARLAKQEYENRTNIQKVKDTASDALDAVRTVQTNPDLSFFGRQGIKYLVTHPIKGPKLFWESVKQAGSQKRYDRWLYDIHNSDAWKLIEDSKLAVLDPSTLHASMREEQWRSQLIHKIPIAGQIAKASERAFTSAANMARVDWFMEGVDILRKQGKTWENSPEEYKGWASAVNNMTGRGGLGAFEPVVGQLAIPFWSPRLIASNVNLFLNPRYYMKMPKTARIMLIKNMAQYIVTGAAFLGLANTLGAETETDPRSSDFGKIKVGNTRYDIWGGASQYIRAFAQLLTASRKTSDNVEDLNIRSQIMTGSNLIRSKLSPIFGFAIDAKLGENIVGEKVEWKDAYKLMIPMLYNDIKEAANDSKGGPESATVAGLLSFLGIGASTYGDKNKSTSQSASQYREKPTRIKQTRVNPHKR